MFTVTSIYVISCLHLLHNIFTNLSPLWIRMYKSFSNWDILRNYSTIFRSSHRRCSIKKANPNILWYSQENTCAGVYFLIKLHAIRRLTLLKRDSNRDIFLWISRNLWEDLFWRTLANDCIVGKCFVRTFLRSDLNLARRNYWWLAVWQVAQISQDWIILPTIKYYVRRSNS